jgi:hypothetical protein
MRKTVLTKFRWTPRSFVAVRESLNGTKLPVSGGGSGATAIGGTADMQARRGSAGETWGRGPGPNESFERYIWSSETLHRPVVGWFRDDLADKARVSSATVKKFEAQDSDAKLSTVQKCRRALESAGVEFIEPIDGKGPGVRLKKDGKRK